MTTYELDELQMYIKQPDTVQTAKELLSSLGLDEKYTKLYLSTYLFIKVPDFYRDLTDEFKSIIHKVYNNENLIENLPKYKEMFNTWKQSSASSLVEEIHHMRRKTRESSSKTENDNCKLCYDTQDNILSIAETYFKEKTE